MERPDWSAAAAMLADVKRAWAGIDEVQQRVLAVTGVAWSDDRLIKVVVGPRGQIVELDIDPRVYRNPNSKALAASIVATARLAAEDAAKQTAALIDETLPSDLKMDQIGGGFAKLIRSHDADLRKEEGEEHG
jgi:DNA-binding protein YbaB